LQVVAQGLSIAYAAPAMYASLYDEVRSFYRRDITRFSIPRMQLWIGERLIRWMFEPASPFWRRA
jgi:hypothetical protein